MEYYEPERSSLDVAMWAGMTLSEQFLMKYSASPKTLHGLSHREWADWSDTLVFLMETPEIFIDKITGPRTEALMTEGKDEFLQNVTDKGLRSTLPQSPAETSGLRTRLRKDTPISIPATSRHSSSS